MKLPQLSSEEKKKFQDGVIQVNGKAMNRTALGIIAAYFQLNPNVTFAELKEAFPDSINPSGPRAPKTIFKPFTERDFGVVHSLKEIKAEFKKADLPYEGLFFLEKDEMFKTSDGVTVVVNKLWESKDTETGEKDLENLANVAINYGIVVNKFEAVKSFTRGSYSLDILKPELYEKIRQEVKVIEKEVIREKTVEKKFIPFWVWIVLGLAGIIILLWALGVFKSDPVVVEKETVKVVVDTVFVQEVKEVEKIEKEFNAVQFELGKYDIPNKAKVVLEELATYLNENPEINLKIEGHTSKEGSKVFNQTLSENRAKAVVEFLIELGVSAERLTSTGLGSSKPIDAESLDVNRRTEFVIINK